MIFITLIPFVAFIFRIPSNLVKDGGFLIGVGFALAIVPLIVLEIYKLIYHFIQKDVLSVATITSFEMIKHPREAKKNRSRVARK